MTDTLLEETSGLGKLTLSLPHKKEKSGRNFSLDQLVLPRFLGPRGTYPTYPLEQERIDTVKSNLKKLKKKVDRSKVKKWLFAEIYDEEFRRMLSAIKAARYESADINTSGDKNGDIWDYGARQFILVGNSDDPEKAYISKSARMVRRNNRFGIIPTELSLIREEREIEVFREKLGEHPDKHLLRISAIDPESRKNIQDYLSRYHRESQYEIGSLIGDDKLFISPILLITGFAKLVLDEGIKTIIVTVHPSHKNSYLRILPFQQLTSHYRDHFDRDAVTLGVDYYHIQRVRSEIECLLEDNTYVRSFANILREHLSAQK
jgi:hypothetical protein